MKKPGPRDVGASVRARLLSIAHREGDDFQHVLTRFANERLLFRLGSSVYRERFVLKGAALFTMWTGNPHRATRDLDFLGFGESSVEHVRHVFSNVLTLDVQDDGVHFDLGTLDVGPIRAEQPYLGVRLECRAMIGGARVRVQVDVGFGDAITPEAREGEFPALLDFPAPRLRVYPRETVVAEKLEAMVQLGLANSRMKDFYDVAVLSRDFDFDGRTLAAAIVATFMRRGTSIPSSTPVAFSAAFVDDPTKELQWGGFTRKSGIPDAGSLAGTVFAVRRFVEPLLLASSSGTAPPRIWRAGQGWL
jgi:hypothetical protein